MVFSLQTKVASQLAVLDGELAQFKSGVLAMIPVIVEKTNEMLVEVFKKYNVAGTFSKVAILEKEIAALNQMVHSSMLSICAAWWSR